MYQVREAFLQAVQLFAYLCGKYGVDPVMKVGMRWWLRRRILIGFDCEKINYLV